MHCNNIDKIDNIEEYKKYGINYYRIELFDENKKDADKIIKKIKDKLKR